jgi:DNA-binding MarR family transcriptional regulator
MYLAQWSKCHRALLEYFTMVKESRRDDTADLLHSAAIRVLRFARTADIEMDLDGPRASALSVLVFVGPMPLSRLAQMEQVSPPAITKTIGSLEAAGLAVRERSAEDRRVIRAAATPAGRALLQRGRAARVRRIEGVLADLPDDDRRVLHRAAALLLDKFGAARG